uniref:restin homolog isoform X1 n=1 Tax=Solea senegalensis TaxID=28829 RepID=UPI001CD90209|nr:restin homolog isoform X1 [Solea senegalensis]
MHYLFYYCADDLGNKDGTCAERLKAELCLPLHAANMDTLTHQRRRITRSCSLGDALTRSTTFHALTHTIEQHLEEEGSPQKRRITIASYVTQSKDQNGNFAEKDVDRQVAKCLRELNTDELCQWFTNIGLQKCLPFIKEAKLCGVDMASVDVNTLDILQVATLEDREQLLSAIYNELHPPSAMVLRLDSLLESSRPPNVETFTATLASMSKSKSAPHVSRLPMNRRSLKLSQNYMAQRNSQLIEVTINASERIVHLRTPRETTAGKIKDSCMKMLGITEDKSLFTLKEKQGSAEELPADQQIGSLLTKTSDKRQLELYLCKMEKPTPTASQNSPEVKRTNENVNISIKVEGSQSAKQERIRELNQQVDSLQNVIFQVQELHHSLVAFCTELKNMDGDLNIDRLGSDELKQRLESVQSQLNDKRQSLQNLRDNMDNLAALKNKQLEVGLLEKMKLNCQVFKEDISMVHLNRQAAHLQKALQESKDKAQKMSQAIGSLSQLVSPQSPAMLLVVQENQGPDGHYGFACCYTEGNGLVVDKVDNTHLCVDDRLVEVNSVPVVNYTQEELTDLLLQGPTAQIVVLRQPPPALACLQHLVNPDPMKSTCLQSDVVTMETPPRRKVMAI